MIQTSFRFMVYDKAKLVGILFGIVISVFLMGQQLGIFNSITGNMQGVAQYNQQYIWVLSKSTKNANQLLAMDSRIGRELRSVPFVSKVYPMVITGGLAKFSNGTKLSVQLVGTAGPDYLGGADVLLDGVSNDVLINEGAVFADISDKYSFPDSGKVGTYFQINDQRAFLAGYTKGHSGFGSSYLFTTIERARKFTSMSSNEVNVFLVEYDSVAVKPTSVVKYINENIPSVKAFIGKDFADETYQYMMTTSNIAASFGMMVLFALIAGFAIVGLTLYSSVNDRIKDYGTIKAIGGDNGTIRKLILTQAVLYAVIGFCFAFGLLWLFKLAMSGGRMSISYSPGLIVFLMFITLLMSLFGSLFALRKIIKLEPVQIFRM